MREIYLDNNATTRPTPSVVRAVLRALNETGGNPSSAHSAGERSRELIRTARDDVARLIGAEPEHVIFTSSGTESNNAALNSALCQSLGAEHVVTTSIEHSSVLEHCATLERRGTRVTYVQVPRNGRIEVEALKDALEMNTRVVSMQWVNNETGVIQPVEAVGRLCEERQILFHVDGAQAVGKLPIDVAKLPIDFLSFTGHKFHAPAGIGALYLKSPNKFWRLIHGGGQENGRRAGTENLLGIAGLGQAARDRVEEADRVGGHVQDLRDYFEARVLEAVPGIKINGVEAPRSNNTSNILFEGVDGEALVARLDQAGIRCSQSSACTNARPEPSHVLRAMGLSEVEAYSSVRFGFSYENTQRDVDRVVDELKTLCESLRAFAAVGNATA